MNQRQFEEIENRIREASEGASLPFDEENWEKMNLLLNKEFPEKRKRGLFLWFGFLLALVLAGSIFFLPVQNNNAPQFPPASGAGQLPASIQRHERGGAPHAGGHVNVPASVSSEHLLTMERESHILSDMVDTKKTLAGNIREAPEDVSLPSGQENREKMNPSPDKQPAYADYKRDASAQTPLNRHTGSSLESEDENKTGVKAGGTKTSGDDFKAIGGLYFIAAGSFVNNSAVSAPSNDISEEYGIGIGYRINKRLSVQMGIYAGKKKYKADKHDYYMEPGSYYTTVDDLKIKADCYVFDIPVSVRYDLVQSKKYSFYGTAGVSSYIMKKESYVYSYFKNGAAHNAERTYTGNRHFLSIADLSAGYERRLTSNVSLLVEPYIKIPLSGIGEGRVKLHTAGLLLGIKYNLPRKGK